MTVISHATALGAGQTSLFGNTQPKLGGTLGTGAFGAPGFNTSTATLGFGAPQPAVGECNFNPSLIVAFSLVPDIPKHRSAATQMLWRGGRMLSFYLRPLLFSVAAETTLITFFWC